MLWVIPLLKVQVITRIVLIPLAEMLSMTLMVEVILKLMVMLVVML